MSAVHNFTNITGASEGHKRKAVETDTAFVFGQTMKTLVAGVKTVIDLTGSAFVFKIYDSADLLLATWSTANGKWLIDDAAGGHHKSNAGAADVNLVAVGKHRYTLLWTDSGGTPIRTQEGEFERVK